MSDFPVYINPDYCARLQGRSVRECICMLPDEGGFIPCPPAARGVLDGHRSIVERPVHPAFERDLCRHGIERADCPRCEPTPALEEDREAGAPAFSGDICQDCGSPSMVRTGTCLTCQNCGSTSGGCS